ncbi:MAG: hypothetical protein ABSG96_10935 [Terracidiphilus sp.]|jgi:hypothetical protein
MEELLVALLAGIAELLGEVLIELVAEALTAFVVRAFRSVFGESMAFGTILAALGYLMLGAVFGGLSVIILPHPLIHPTRIHGASLVISPIVTGLIMAQIGLVRRRNDKDVLRIESFGYGFTLALGAAIARFLFVR